METLVVVLALGFTLPGIDHYSPAFQLQNMGTVKTLQECDGILIAPDNALKITGGTETPDLKLAREGMCIKGVSNTKAKAAMLVEAAARIPRIHNHYYTSAVLPHFATLSECNRSVSKLSALLDNPSVAEHIDIWGTCYAI